MVFLALAVLLSAWLSFDAPLSDGVLEDSPGGIAFALAFLVAVVSMPTPIGVAACAMYGVSWFLDFEPFHHYRAHFDGFYTAWVLPCLIVAGFVFLWRRLEPRTPAAFLSTASGALGAALTLKVFFDASTKFDGVFRPDIWSWAFPTALGLALWAMPTTLRLAFIGTFVVFYVSDVLAFGPHVFLSALVPQGKFDTTVLPSIHDRRALLNREESFEAIGVVATVLVSISVLAVRAYRRLRPRVDVEGAAFAGSPSACFMGLLSAVMRDLRGAS